MKRSGPPAGGPNKAARGDGDDDAGNSQTFEEQLIAMDESEGMGDERVDAADDDSDPLIMVKKWSRPGVVSFDAMKEPLTFHWVDIDVTSGAPMDKNPCEGAKVIGSREAIVPIIRLYGSTRDGSSVLTYVHGFTSYFYVALPPSTNLSDQARAQLRIELDRIVSTAQIRSLR